MRAFLFGAGYTLVVALAVLGCSERTQTYPGQFGTRPWLYPSSRVRPQPGSVAPSTSPPPAPQASSPDSPSVSRSNGNFYDHYEVKGLFHELRITDEYPDAAFAISFGVAGIGFDKGPDGRACSTNVYVGRASTEGAAYDDRDGNGRFESRSRSSAERAEIVFENGWVPIANVRGSLKTGVVMGVQPDPRPDIGRSLFLSPRGGE